MIRLLVFVTAFLFVAGPAPAQTQTWSETDLSVVKPTVQPPEPLPERSLSRHALRLPGAAVAAPPSDTLSEAEILTRIGRVYRYQADILAAQAQGDAELTERLFGMAMAELGTLVDQPDIMDRPRFRELYRTVVTEYERYYGVSDTLLTLPHGEIFQLRADMFAVLDEVDEPLLEDVMMPDLPPMETVFPMTMNRLVERSIEFLLRERRDVVERWISRADTYFPMIERIFQEEGVPDELKYLAMVESGLNPRARSWARAVGMWQFISATGRAYGLEVNPWVDERMDPEKATRAAARHLKDLYEMYNHDWQIAIAGYNCSPRCIKRAIRRAGGTATYQPSFWDIYRYLPRETRNYVPLFIATALITSNPEAFGLSPKPGPRYAYDHVPVQGMISLQDIARMAGTDLATIRALNPELRRQTLPPSRHPYMVRIPLGSYQHFAEAYAELPESAKRPVGEYVVRRGDTLGKIAAQYGLSVGALKQANGIRGHIIHPGQRLVVPVPDYTSSYSLADAKPVSVEYGPRVVRPIQPLEPIPSGTNGSTPVVTASDTSPRTTTTSSDEESASEAREAESEKEAPPSDTRIVYHVRRGDTLGEIARKYGVSVRDLQRWNNLRSTRIRAGQQLSIYAANDGDPEPVVYRVRRGDNLTVIASRHGVSVSDLRRWNNLRSSRIYPGQQLTIYPGSSAPEYVVYRVRRGDNLTEIARKYGVSVRDLKRWNNLRSSRIYPGQRLKIYS